MIEYSHCVLVCTFLHRDPHQRVTHTVERPAIIDESQEYLPGNSCGTDQSVLLGALWHCSISSTRPIELCNLLCYLGNLIGARGGGAEEESRATVRCA